MSFLFDGTNDSLTGTLTSAIDTPLTIACWFKYTTHPSAVDDICAIGANSGSNTSSYRLRTNTTTDGFVPLSTDDAAANNSVNMTKSCDGVWTPFLLVVTSDSLRDGYVADQTAQGTATNGGVVPVSFLKVGEGFAGANDFVGRVAEFCVWNAALTAPQIAEFIAGSSPAGIAAGNLVEYVSMATNSLLNLGTDAGGDLTANGNAVFDADHPTIISGAAPTLYVVRGGLRFN